MACDDELKEYKQCGADKSYKECRKDYRKYSSCMKKLGLVPVPEEKPVKGGGGGGGHIFCKTVEVHSYTRERLGRTENVSAYTRSSCSQKQIEELVTPLIQKKRR